MSEHGPKSLKQEIDLGNFPGEDKARTGRFIKVNKLINLPSAIREKFPGGMVIKRYAFWFGPRDYHDLFDTTAAERWPLYQQASILKKRFAYVKNLFAIMPNLVIPTEYFVEVKGEQYSDSIGPDEPAPWSASSKGDIYEIQPEVKFIAGLRTFSESLLQMRDAIPLFESFSVDIIRKLLQQLKEIENIIENEKTTHIPDILGGDNLALTENGEWKLLDTNKLYIKGKAIHNEDREAVALNISAIHDAISFIEGCLKRKTAQ